MYNILYIYIYICIYKCRRKLCDASRLVSLYVPFMLRLSQLFDSAFRHNVIIMIFELRITDLLH